MSNNGFLVKVINTIDDNKVHYNSCEDILVIKTNECNINKYYILGKSNKKLCFDQFVDGFISINDEYIISYDFDSVEDILVKLLKAYNLTISFAESCTGGLMAATLINISGASDVIKESYVTYSEAAKMKILNVQKDTLDEFSVYSKETALEMAKGLSEITNANINVSITGLAGGNSFNHNDGSYDSCIIINYNNKQTITQISKHEKGTRNDVRKKQVNYVFYRVIKALKSIL